MTKSIVKAKDYDVKIKFNGVEQFIPLGDIEINEKPLNDYLKDLGELINDFKIFERKASNELKRLRGVITNLSNDNERLDKELANANKVIRNAITSKLKVGF